MLEFFKNLLRVDTPESSKRFTQLYSLFLLTFVIIISLIGVFFQIVASDIIATIIYSLIGIITGQSILTVVQNNSNSISKKEGEKAETKPVYSEEEMKI